MRHGVTLVLVALIGTEQFALAEKCEDEKAKKDVLAGKRLFDRGRYEEAIPLWEGAYDVCPSPDLLFNMAQAHRALGHLEDAITLYRSWLREAPNADADLRREIENRVTELADLLAAQRKTAEKPPTGTVVSEPKPGEGRTTAPPAHDLSQPIGHVDGTPATMPVVISEPWYRDRAGVVLASSGVVAAGVGAAFYFYGGSLRDDAAAERDQAKSQDMLDTAKSYRLIGDVVFWAGAAVAVAGCVKLAIPNRRVEKASSPSVQASILPGWIVLRGSF